MTLRKRIEYFFDGDGILYILMVFCVIIGLAAMTAPKPDLPGVCIYEVSISLENNLVNIGWTLSPCQDLDIRNNVDYQLLQHSSFHPVCPVFSIQTWPEIFIPVVDYARGCDLSLFNQQREANGTENQ